MKSNIKSIFYPKNLCVAGASAKEKSIGYELLKCIKEYGFTGNVFPVNPNNSEILGYKTYSSVLEINSELDLGIVVVPKKFIEETIDQFIQKKVKSLIIITAGFKEIGEEGKLLENRIREKLNRNGIHFVGPNCMGVINSTDEIKLNATFVAEKPEFGKIAFLSQSGALGAAVLNSLRQSDIRFAHFISVGNKADLNENDFLEYWANDDLIQVITMYLESFENGFDFLRMFIQKKINKPVIVLKAGRTASGIKAASSHTGAISSNDEITDSLLKQFGIIRVETINELFNTAKGFEYFQMPKGNRIAVITNAGGPAILAVDKLEQEGLELSKLEDDTKEKLRLIVQPEGSVNNPVDLLPGGTAETYKSAIEILLSDKNVDAVISIFVEPVMVQPIPVVQSINSIYSDKPVFQVVFPLPEFWDEYKKVSNKPLFKNSEEPAEIISNMLLYAKKQWASNEYQQRLLNLKSKTIQTSTSEFLSIKETNKLLSDYNIPFPKQLLAQNISEIEKIGEDFFPCVIKGINLEHTHKTELKAVKLNLQNQTELIQAAKEIEFNMTSQGVSPEKYLIQKFIKPKYEILLGGLRDLSFGPVTTFGIGGTFVEVMNDKSIRSSFASPDDIIEMINETKIGKIISGIRGEKPVDIKRLVEIILSFNKMLVENTNIIEIDINPMIVDVNNSFYAVDTRIKIN
ncbi:MAG: acetate--CoA ligase [Ignavibacteriales bacterium]